MYRLTGFFGNQEHQMLVSSFSDAMRILQRSKSKANCILVKDEGGRIKASYLKNLGVSVC